MLKEDQYTVLRGYTVLFVSGSAVFFWFGCFACFFFHRLLLAYAAQCQTGRSCHMFLQQNFSKSVITPKTAAQLIGSHRRSDEPLGQAFAAQGRTELCSREQHWTAPASAAQSMAMATLRLHPHSQLTKALTDIESDSDFWATSFRNKRIRSTRHKNRPQKTTQKENKFKTGMKGGEG